MKIIINIVLEEIDESKQDLKKNQSYPKRNPKKTI